MTSSGTESSATFDDIRRRSNQFANQLLRDGLSKGDRVAVLLPQSIDTAIAHIGTFKAGLISVPMSLKFADDAIEYRIRHSGAKAIVTDQSGVAAIDRICRRPDGVSCVYVCDQLDGRSGQQTDVRAFATALQHDDDTFSPVVTLARDPALIIYTSGTEGKPKGVLLPHQVLLGRLPCLELCHGFADITDAVCWTPADWAWTAGLFNGLLCPLYYGMTVVVHPPGVFRPQDAVELMGHFEVSHAFLPPAAIRLMRVAHVGRGRTKLRSILTGGEALGVDVLAWVRETFNVDVHEGYGQTECSAVVGNCTRLFPVRPGSMGRALPGHRVRVVNERGCVVRPGETGVVSVEAPDPVLLITYWNDPAAHRQKFAGQSFLTGDLARLDEDGYLWHVGRSDDVINCAGHRVGPDEVENIIREHESVAEVAVVGVPDPIMREAIKAWIVLRPEYEPSDELACEIRGFVRARAGKQEWLRYIEFLDSLPLTASGKIARGELRSRC